MSASAVAAALWAAAATVVALLPVRWQFAPGFVLLLAAPVLIVRIGFDHGWGWSVAALAAFVSMFRRPLRHLWRRLRGRKKEARG